MSVRVCLTLALLLVSVAPAAAQVRDGGSVYIPPTDLISGTLTTNKIPKASGANTLADSSLTDDGSTVTSAVPIAVGAAPAQSGALRLENAAGIKARGVGGAGDIPVISTTAGDAVAVGGAGLSGMTLEAPSISVLGELLFTDNATDIGAPGATRPRTAYFGTSVVVPSGTGAAPSLSFGLGGFFLNGNSYLWTSRSGADNNVGFFASGIGFGASPGDSFLSRSAAGHLKVTTDGTTLGTLSAAKFTTTGTGTYSGVTLADGEKVGVSAGGTLTFQSSSVTTGSVRVDRAGTAYTYTSGSAALMGLDASFTPASGSGSFAGIHGVFDINGTSSGTAYGLVVASKTNTLTGGTIRLLSLGTTTTDAFTGYSERLYVDTAGAIYVPSVVATGSAAVVAQASAAADNLLDAYGNLDGTGAHVRARRSTGENAALRSNSTTVAAAAGASITTATTVPAGIIPAGARVAFVVTRTTTAFGASGGLTSIDIGDGSDVDLFANDAAITLNATTNGVNHTATPGLYAAAAHVVITGVGGNFDNTGAIRVTVFYWDSTAPTS